MPRRSLIVFWLLILYVFLAWAYWTWSLVDLRQSEAKNAIKHLQEKSKQVKTELTAWIRQQPHLSKQELSIQLQKMAHEKYPKFQIMLLDAKNPNDTNPPLFAGPHPEAIKTIDEYKNRKITQYFLEAFVFLALLFWGIIYILRNANKSRRMAAQQQNFVLAVTHELKTPVAAIKLLLQTLLRQTLPKEKEPEFIGKTLQETDRLEELVDNILLSTQLESGGNTLQFQPQLLKDIVSNAVQRFQQLHPNRTITITSQTDSYITGDEKLLYLLVNNLLGNSIKYSPLSIPIQLNLHNEDQTLVLTIKDGGLPIPEDEKEKIFSKFYRLGNEDTRKTKGTGLGLFLVKQIVDLHQGKIHIEPSMPEGNIWILQFPITEEIQDNEQ